MKAIPLTQNQIALVDDCDYAYLMQWKWYVYWDPDTRSYRVVRNSPRVNGRQDTIYMSRVIMNAKPDELVDHKDHDTLNNQRHNLRKCTALKIE